MSPFLLAVLTGVATGASKARHSGFSFTAADTLIWSVPMLLIAPLIGLLVLLSAVRTRRGASLLSAITIVVTLLDAILVLVARFSQDLPRTATFQWINVSIAFTGDSRFQNFVLDLSFRIDHAVLALIITGLLVALAAVVWQRSAGRQEPGPIRSQIWLLVLVLAGTGVLVSSDLVAVAGFWLLAGLASYFLLGNRWGSDAQSRGAAIAFALPFAGDLALLGAVGLLYAKFGVSEIDQLVPQLGQVGGVTTRYVGVATLLVLVAAAVRSALWPFTVWQTGTAEAGPAASAWVAGVWPLLAGQLVHLTLPLYAHAGVATPRIAAWALLVLALAGPLLAFAQLELRRLLLLASSGAIALCLLGIVDVRSAAAALAGLMAIGLGRAAMLLGAGWITEQMRTGDLRLLGGGLRRIRLATLGLGVGAVATAFGAASASAWRHPSAAWAGPAIALLVLSLALGRGWASAALGDVPRRRAFEPSRLQDPREGAVVATLWCGGLGVVAVAGSFVWPCLHFLVPGVPPSPPVLTLLAWLLPSLVGLAAAVAVAQRARSSALAGQRRLAHIVFQVDRRGRRLWRLAWTGGVMRLYRGVELRELPGLESVTGRGLSSVAGGPPPGVPVLTIGALALVALGVVLALAGVGAGR